MVAAAAHDVVVVGGRVGGALTAALMADRGYSVLVLEARTFPAGTISTHFFRGDGLVRVLDQVGALDRVLATGAPPLVRQYFHLAGQDGQEEPPQEPGTAGYCLSVRRETLDHVLAGHVAAMDGVDFRWGVTAADVLRQGQCVVGVLDTAGRTYPARLVVGADGYRSGVAAWVQATDERRLPPERALYYRYFSGWHAPGGAAPDAAEFSLIGNEMVYVFPSDDELTCVAVSIPVACYERARRGAAEFFDERIHAHPGLASRIGVATPRSRVFAGPPRDSYIRVASGPGWALVGDAGTHQDPWSGAGMDTAARQAEVLSRTWDPQSEWQGDFAEARRAVTDHVFEETVSAAPDLRVLLE